MLKFEHLNLRRANRLLFEDATFLIHRGQKVGISGSNGCGKSSLLALIQGELTADAGTFTQPDNISIAHVAQETKAVAMPALDYVLAGDTDLMRLRDALAVAEQANDGAAIANLHAKLEIIGGYSAESRAAQLMHGLGFLPTMQRTPVAQLSGGWRMRLNLARALMCRSDLLLLDEPTNHLDLDAVIWLEHWLTTYPGTLLLIAHDRDFLDAIVDSVLYIEQQHVTLYRGGYSDTERQRAEQLAQQQSAYVLQQKTIEHIHSFVTRFRAKATKARQAQSRLRALERMELIAPVRINAPFQFNFPLPERLPSPLLHLDAVSVGYANKTVLQQINLSLAPGDRIGLLGPNGAGKSTLIKLLAGELKAVAGEIQTAQYLNTAYFAQHQLEQLRLDQTPLWHLTVQEPKASEQELRNFLGSFGFSGERVQEPVAPFSGGEKARLVLALLVARRPNLLLLDEPTNHLDLSMRQALSEALQSYEGAVVLVSHDRYLLRMCVDRLLLVYNGTVQEFDGDLDDYPSWLARSRVAVEVEGRTNSLNESNVVVRKERRRQDALQRQRLQPLKNRLRRVEKELQALQLRQQTLQVELSQPEVYAEKFKSQFLQKLIEQKQLKQNIQSLETEWLEISEELTTAS